MRFKPSSPQLLASLQDWVHHGIEPDNPLFKEHFGFLKAAVGAACAAVLAGPAIVVTNGLSGVGVLAIAALFAVLASAAFIVSRWGMLDAGRAVMLVTAAILLSSACLVTGASASPLLITLLVFPLQATLWSSRRMIFLGFALASTAFALVLSLPNFVPAMRAAADIWQVAGVGLAAIYCLWLGLTHVKRYSAAYQAKTDAERQTSILTNNVGELITRHNSAGATLFASPASRSVFGVNSGELLRSGFVERVHLQDRISFMKCVSDAAHTSRAQSCEIRVRHKGNKGKVWKWLHVSFNPIRNDATGQMEVVAVSRDISDVKALAQDLQQANVKADETAHLQRRFLATMSHELRTPLNAIIGFADLMQHQMADKPENEKHREYAALVRDSGHHLLHVINDMLDMSRIESGKYQLSAQSFAFVEIAEATVEMLHPLAIKADVELICDVPDGLPDMIADRRACQQILINLVSNAIKFSNDGGFVRLSIRQYGRRLKIKVSDNGIGIPADFIESIGQPFMQADRGLDREYEGSGLGLSVVKGLVDLHGGDFDVASEHGKGTTVTLSLPLKANIARPVPADEQTILVNLPDGSPKTNEFAKRLDKVEDKGESSARVSA